MTVTQVSEKLRGAMGTSVTVTFLRDGEEPREVTLVREVIKVESVTSRMEGDFGYLRISTFNENTGRELTTAIEKIRRDHPDVKGFVLDLRNNGGGSLQEATELTGLFIDQGPTVLVRNSDGRVDVLADENTGIFYKGPMAVLVNRLSASASEIFAGAMQDYHRALIIGGQTFGKGTVQTIQPLNHGELKLTLAKFYRVSGQSTQHQGVIPDIEYPSVVDTKEIGESALPEAMPWDSIRPAIKPEIDPFKPFLSKLKARHDSRTAHNPDFVYSRERLAL
eukprot:gene52871-64598_t